MHRYGRKPKPVYAANALLNYLRSRDFFVFIRFVAMVMVLLLVFVSLSNVADTNGR